MHRGLSNKKVECGLRISQKGDIPERVQALFDASVDVAVDFRSRYYVKAHSNSKDCRFADSRRFLLQLKCKQM